MVMNEGLKLLVRRKIKTEDVKIKGGQEFPVESRHVIDNERKLLVQICKNIQSKTE